MLLLRPFLYLRVNHGSGTLPWMNWGVPALVTISATAFVALVVPEANLFHASGVFERLLGFVQNLPGFFLAALAAVATFARPNLDQLMPGQPPTVAILFHGQLKKVDLTRRRFLSLLFSYLTALSFGITLLLVVGLPVVDHFRAVVPAAALGWVRAMVAFPVVFFTAQMVTITLWGLYYLGERMHTPD